MDTHSVKILADVEEVLALFQVKLMPVSAGTPLEMAFAESKVRSIKRMSTAMLLCVTLTCKLLGIGGQIRNIHQRFHAGANQTERMSVLSTHW